jgi:hypothetical protein
MARVWAESAQSGSHLLMMLAIADFADDDGNAYPAVATLARKCRMSPRNANLVLTALRASGELEVRANEGPKGTNRYRVRYPAEPLKPASPLKSASPLKPASATPEAGFPKPLKPASDEPSMNHQEPSGRARDARRTRMCPTSFTVTDDLKAWAKEACPQVDIERETERFRNWEYDKPKSNWKAAWRNWMLGAVKFMSSKAKRTGFDSTDYGTDI